MFDAPWKVGLWIAVTALIGIPLGYWKNNWWRGWLGVLLLGPIGILIMLLIPVSDEARIRREQRRMQRAQERLAIQAEAGRRLAAQPPHQAPYGQQQAQQYPASPYDKP